jgi:hypothetical protein
VDRRVCDSAGTLPGLSRTERRRQLKPGPVYRRLDRRLIDADDTRQ